MPTGTAGDPRRRVSASAEDQGRGRREGVGDLAQAYSQNPEFFAFYRSLEAYKATFRNKSDLMVLDPAPISSSTSSNRAPRAPRAPPSSARAECQACVRQGKRVPDSLWTALALLLMFEGLLPFIAPRFWREGFSRMTELTDGQLRFVGMVSVGVGLLGLYVTSL